MIRYGIKFGPRLLIGFVLLLVLAACDQQPTQIVNLNDRAPLAEVDLRSDRQGLKLGIGAVITPEQGYAYYEEMVAYLGEELQQPITLVDPGTYAQLNEMLGDGRVDVAFVCAGPYVEGHQQFGLELLAAPVVKGEPAYYSNLIVPADSPVQTLADLRGKTFVFTDPHSNSGALVPTAELARLGATPEDFFAAFSYTYAHDRSIHTVADKLVDGAAVDSLIWDYLVAIEPELQRRVRVVERYGPFGIPPVVVRPGLPPERKEQLRALLLGLHETPRGREILKKLHIDRFEPITDQAYDSIRQMQAKTRQDTP